MADVQKAFRKEPPREPLDTVAAVCRDFKWRYADREGRDMVVEYCRAAPNGYEAILRACRSRNAQGKMHNHQTRVPETLREALAQRLADDNYRGKVPMRRMTFDQLHDWVKRNGRAGIGAVTTYDVSVRIGAWLGIEPESVYLHAGARQGAGLLLQARFPEGKVDRLPRSVFPEPLNELDADSIEDILCTYRAMWPAIVGREMFDRKNVRRDL